MKIQKIDKNLKIKFYDDIITAAQEIYTTKKVWQVVVDIANALNNQTIIYNAKWKIINI